MLQMGTVLDLHYIYSPLDGSKHHLAKQHGVIFKVCVYIKYYIQVPHTAKLDCCVLNRSTAFFLE